MHDMCETYNVSDFMFLDAQSSFGSHRLHHSNFLFDSNLLRWNFHLVGSIGILRVIVSRRGRGKPEPESEQTRGRLRIISDAKWKSRTVPTCTFCALSVNNGLWILSFDFKLFRKFAINKKWVPKCFVFGNLFFWIRSQIMLITR